MIKNIDNIKDTEEVAKFLGAELKGDEIICLYGDLGSGKTTFTKFLLKSLGVDREVLSPTFTLRTDYMSNLSNIYHFDWYRMDMYDDLYGIDFFDVLKNGIVIIEWADKFEKALDNYDKIKIFFYFKDDSRYIKIIE
jgi:tRNA threonylcarbamoyladenosine biosynthesis protein TsaE